MFRNMLKRSFLSIKRKLGRTVILTLIFFMMANLVLAAIIIKSAVAAEMDYAKSTLGGSVTIQADMDAIRDEQKEKIDAGTDPSKMFGKMVRPSVDVKTANKIASYSDYVKDYSYEVSTSANSSSLETVETRGKMPGMPGMGNFPGQETSDDESALDGDITISGINAYAYISAVKNETMTLKDGTYFDEDSTDQALISYEFAELNGLKVGDTFKIKNIYTEKDVKLTVIGIYDTSDGRSDANTIYLNTETAAKFLSNDDFNDGNYNVDNVTFYMANSENADEFVEKINSDFSSLKEDNLKVAVDTSEYDAMAGQIESVGSFATTILIIVIVAAVIIITLIVTINVKDRRYEMGVLLSLGASKKNVIGQIATELLIVGTLGFALASISGGFLASSLGNSIIESQTASSAKQQEKSFGRPGAQPGGNGGNGGNGAPNMPSMPGGNGSMPDPGDAKSMKDVISAGANAKKVELDINAEPLDYLLLFLTGYLVILIALIIPSINMMRYQPKEILTGKE